MIPRQRPLGVSHRGLQLQGALADAPGGHKRVPVLVVQTLAFQAVLASETE